MRALLIMVALAVVGAAAGTDGGAGGAAAAALAQEEERAALLDLSRSVGPGSRLAWDGGGGGAQHCEWQGVTCSPLLDGQAATPPPCPAPPGSVVELRLAHLGLAGPLPGEPLSRLRHLQVLDLSGNSGKAHDSLGGHRTHLLLQWAPYIHAAWGTRTGPLGGPPCGLAQ